MLCVSAHALSTDPVTAARLLLGATLITGAGITGGVTARIVEVEAYGGSPDGPWPDPAAHSYRGPTVRNAVMFGPPGRLYTYRSHGIHVCANISCGPDGTAAAVLLRAAVIECGTGEARARRGPMVAEPALARGPGNLCSALAITMEHNGVDVFGAESPVRVRFADPAGDPVADPVCGLRVGVSVAADRPWRFWLAGHPEVSAYRRSPRAARPGAGD